MKRKGLPMMNVLNGGYIFTIFVFWIIPYMFLPSLTPFLGHGLWENLAALGWIDLVCCAISGVGMLLILKEHLSDTWFDVSVAPKEYLLAALDGFLLMLLWVLGFMMLTWMLWGELMLIGDFLPVSEFTMNMVPILLLESHPILTTLVFSLLSPFAVCGMFYAAGFAPLCSRKPWLGYLNVALILLLAMGIKAFWYRIPGFTTLEYIVQLPVHLIACRAYQKTDNLWTPIFTIGALNFTTSVLFYVMWTVM